MSLSELRKSFETGRKVWPTTRIPRGRQAWANSTPFQLQRGGLFDLDFDFVSIRLQHKERWDRNINTRSVICHVRYLCFTVCGTHSLSEHKHTSSAMITPAAPERWARQTGISENTVSTTFNSSERKQIQWYLLHYRPSRWEFVSL